MNSKNLINNEKDELIHNKLKNKFENIKSNYFLQKLFNNIQKKTSLEIIKYNKNIQQK